MLVGAIVALLLVIVHLASVPIPERPARAPTTGDRGPRRTGVDIRGTIRVVGAVPGLFGLILFRPSTTSWAASSWR